MRTLMAKLSVFGPDGQQTYTLGVHNSLGRHPDNTIQVLDRIISKEHCHIDLINGRYVLKDLGSLNGTFVNQQKVSQHVLRDKDEISIGTTRIVFYTQNEDRDFKRIPKVTITPSTVDSQIQTRLAPVLEERFVPENMIADVQTLRRDYEKLRLGYELTQAIGIELDVDRLLDKLLDRLLHIFPADRGAVLLVDETTKELMPRCVKMRKENESDEPLMISSTITSEVIRDSTAVLSNDATVDARFHGARSVIMQCIRSSMAVPLVQGGQTFGVIVLDSQVATNAFTEKDLQLFQNVANQAAMAVQNSFYAKKIERNALMRQQFERLVSPVIVEEVMSGRVDIAKGGQLRKTTVLFGDIRGFTALAESQTPQETVHMLNEHFELMVEVIFKHEGTLDKFVGDAIMALFGAPLMHEDDPLRAVRTAIEMQAVLSKFNIQRTAMNLEPVRMGIGINTGDVVAGYLGSSRALEYTVIGDVVNVGARLCSLAKADEIILSEATYEHVKEHISAVPLPPAKVKGKSQPLRVYRVQPHPENQPFGTERTAIAGI